MIELVSLNYLYFSQSVIVVFLITGILYILLYIREMTKPKMGLNNFVW